MTLSACKFKLPYPIKMYFILPRDAIRILTLNCQWQFTEIPIKEKEEIATGWMANKYFALRWLNSRWHSLCVLSWNAELLLNFFTAVLPKIWEIYDRYLMSRIQDCNRNISPEGRKIENNKITIIIIIIITSFTRADTRGIKPTGFHVQPFTS